MTDVKKIKDRLLLFSMTINVVEPYIVTSRYL